MTRAGVHRKVAVGTALLSLLVTACGAGQPAGGGESAGGGKEPPTPISLMTVLREAEVPVDGNPLEKEIETRTNTELKIQWVPAASYNEKLSVTVAGGDLPDVFEVLSIETNFKDWASQGAFADLDELIQDAHPNLKRFLSQKYVDELRVGNKLYGIPIVQPPGQSIPRVRKDWLEKLNLPEPQTLDDYYNVLKAFTFQDPDGNGKDDTYGMSANGAETRPVFPVLSAFGIKSGKLPFMQDRDGNYVPREITPEMKEAVIWLRKAYEEKILDPEFPGLKGTQAHAKFEAGRIGIVVNAANNIDIGAERLLKNVPTSKIKAIMPPADKQGAQINHYNTNYQGAYVISSKLPKAKQQKIVDWFEWMIGEEAQDLIWWGVPEVHHAGRGGERKTNDKWHTDGVMNYNKQLDIIKINPNIYPPDTRLRDMVQESLETARKANADSPLNGVVITSKKWRSAEKELDKVNAGIVKIIAGNEPVENLDKYVQEWLNNGGSEALKELNEDIRSQLK